MGLLFSCCCKRKGSPDEWAPLITPRQPPDSQSILANIPASPEFLDPELVDLINNLSSEDDDPMDPAQEEKYEAILKGIED